MPTISALPVRADQIEHLADREAWLANRRTGIGASEAAAAIGKSPWKSRLELWGEKTCRLEQPDLSDNERIRWGQRLERVIADGFGEDSGRGIIHWPQTDVVRHAEHHCMFCTPDALTLDDEGVGLLQVKTTGAERLADWDGDAPPLIYQIQVQHELACTGLSKATLACLVGGNRLIWHDIYRDQEFIEALELAELEFWCHVTRDIEPPADLSSASMQAFARIHPQDDGTATELPDEMLTLSRAILDAKSRVKDLMDAIHADEARIKLAIGDHAIGTLADGSQWTWRTQQRGEYTVKASSSRVLRFKEAK